MHFFSVFENEVCNGTARPDFFLQSIYIRVDLQSYESKPIDKQEQYDKLAEKKRTANTQGLQIHPHVVAYSVRILH